MTKIENYNAIGIFLIGAGLLMLVFILYKIYCADNQYLRIFDVRSLLFSCSFTIIIVGLYFSLYY